MEETLDIIDRPMYMERIRPYIGKDIIKILTGQRRIGKSYILRLVAREIQEKWPEANLITINLEDFAFSHITDAATLHSEISGRLVSGKRNFIFLDEIQEVKDFDKVIRSLNLNPDVDIYVTGSNSSMLSAEMASRLAGRSIEIRIHPLSYTEFLRFHRLGDSDEALNHYMRFGGLPYLRNLPLVSTWNEYLSGVTDAVVFRDVVSRHSLRNTDFLRRLLLFLADNTGKIFTAKKIADYLKSQRQTVNVTTVQTYCDYLEEAFIIGRSRRWDIEGKRFFEIGEKFFFEDLGVRNSIIGFRPNDIGGIMENIVYNHLIALGYEVRTGIMKDGKEIDFIAERGGEKVYVQVALTITNENTASREFGNLQRIPDNYEKLVVTLSNSFPNTFEGIKTITLRQFLLDRRKFES